MQMTDENSDNLLASLVRAGNDQTEAEPINDFIWMSKDVSNSFLVKTKAGSVVINAGMPQSGIRHLAAYRQASSSPITHLILTQGHFDHFGGLGAFKEAGARVLAHKKLSDVRAYWRRLGPFYTRRSNALWASVLAMGARPMDWQDRFYPERDVDIFVGDSYAFEEGERRFELIATPGGETFDSIVVWLSKEAVVFTGNLCGPIFLNHPNLNTLRGDLPRDVLRFVNDVRKVQALGAELLITGHGDPIRGAEQIRTDFQKLIDAVLFVHDRTVEGMNAGKSVHQLMEEIKPPPELRIGEGHGNIAINVRSIWEQYAGFFHFHSPTELFEAPASCISADIVELAGGAGNLLARARRHLENGRPLEALHLLDVVQGCGPAHREAADVSIAALEALIEREGTENFSVTMFLKSRIATARKILED
jgi:glyoxylase-like metal-dependent hydrolase (beta-lactamase superfamily II)